MGRNIRMVSLLTIILMLAIFAGGCGDDADKKADSTKKNDVKSSGTAVKIGLDQDFAPASWQENGENKGATCEIIKEAFKRAKVDVEIVLGPWTRVMEDMKSGVLDGIGDCSINKEREQYANFTSEPTKSVKSAFFVLPDSKVNFDGNFSSVQGITIGIQRGFTFGDAFKEAMNNKVINVEESDNFEQLYKKLETKRIDAIATFEFTVGWELKKMSKSNSLKSLQPAIDEKGFFIAFSKKSSKVTPEVISKVNAALAEIMKDGTYQKIWAQYK